MNTTTPPKLEIFNTGTHRPQSDDASISFSESDIAATIAAYDPAKHEAPLVIGHPKSNGPAMGWVESIDSGSGGIEAQSKQVDADFAEQVNDGRFKKISSSFYRPDSPHNPVPGVWYLRHVGFFGAQPVIVKGMRDAAFAEGETESDFVEFSESISTWSMSRFFRGLREFFIEEHGKDKADEVIPSWMAEEADDVARSPKDDESMTGFSEPETKPKTPKENPVKDKDNDSVDFAEEQRKLDTRADQLKAREQAIADKEKEDREQANADFCESNVAKIPGEERQSLALAVMNGLSDEGVADFAEKGKELSPLEGFKKLVEGLPDQADFSEHSTEDDESQISTADFALPDGYDVDGDQAVLHNKAQAYADKNNVDFVAAYKAVGGK